MTIKAASSQDMRELAEELRKAHLCQPDCSADKCRRYCVYARSLLAADLLDQAAAQRDALKGLSDLYGHAWDRTDGALIMLPSGVEKFEAAHAVALAALHPEGKLETSEIEAVGYGEVGME